MTTRIQRLMDERAKAKAAIDAAYGRARESHDSCERDLGEPPAFLRDGDFIMGRAAFAQREYRIVRPVYQGREPKPGEVAEYHERRARTIKEAEDYFDRQDALRDQCRLDELEDACNAAVDRHWRIEELILQAKPREPFDLIVQLDVLKSRENDADIGLAIKVAERALEMMVPAHA